MKKPFAIILTLVAGAAGLTAVYFVSQTNDTIEQTSVTINSSAQEVIPAAEPEPSSEPEPEKAPTNVSFDVVYINESPDGSWDGPWKNGCEEAAIVMVDKYYKGISSISVTEAKAAMQRLFDEQDRRWGSNANSDGARNVELIKTHADFQATLVQDPSIDDIKAELLAKRPVITLHKGFDLHNPNIPFLATGSSYHNLVIVGYDDEAKEFIVNDDGDTKAGKNRRYDYDVLMNSLHDYNYTTKLTDLPPVAIFTRS